MTHDLRFPFTVRADDIPQHHTHNVPAVPLVSSDLSGWRIRLAVFCQFIPNQTHVDHGNHSSNHRELLSHRSNLSVHAEHFDHFRGDFHRRTPRRPRLRQHILPHESRDSFVTKRVCHERGGFKRQCWHHFRRLSRHSHAQLDLPNAGHLKHLKPQRQIKLFSCEPRQRENQFFSICATTFSLKLHPVNLLSSFLLNLKTRWTMNRWDAQKIMEKFVICIFHEEQKSFFPSRHFLMPRR